MCATSPIAKIDSSLVVHASSAMTPPRSPSSRPGLPRELVPRAYAGREDHDVGRDLVAVGELHAGDLAVAAGPQLGGRGGRTHRDAELLDDPAQRAATGLVDLQRHQPVGELDDRRVGAERRQRSCGLETEQAATDDGALDLAAQHSLAVQDPGAELGDVVDRAIDEAAGQVRALDRGHRRVRAGGQHEPVVVERRVAGVDLLGLAVDVSSRSSRGRGVRRAASRARRRRGAGPRGRGRRRTTSAPPGRTAGGSRRRRPRCPRPRRHPARPSPRRGGGRPFRRQRQQASSSGSSCLQR